MEQYRGGITQSLYKDRLAYNGLTIHQLFERQVEHYPDEVAVVFKNRDLNYSELNEKANQLARALISKQVTTDTVVAILLDKSLESVISILAVLKAGGCYLMLDTEYPENRIGYMLSDSQAKVLITTKETGWNARFEGDCILIDDASIWNLPKDNPDIIVQGTDLAYIIYTSGTTGQPKGVLLEHKGIVNLKTFWEETFGITPRDRIGFFASVSFDASVWEIFMALLNGAALYIFSKELVGNLLEFQNYLGENSITVMTLPPSYAIYLEPSLLTSLRLLITAGSASSKDLVNKWSKSVVYVNAYGPTETSICATLWISPCQWFEGKYVPIGTPLRNTRVYILDDDRKPVSPGELGELCIEGIGLARGYLNRPELTADKFINNPFLPGEKLYCTGDYALWLPDGNVEYHGRIDHQVKIRGYRIELGEIEAVLLKHRQITETAVILQKDSQGECYLTAHYVAARELPREEMRALIEADLPHYMIPSHFQCLDQMPLTISGKVDREKLLLPEYNRISGFGHTVPRNSLELLLAKIWQEVLGVERVGVHDNFYLLGGDSIKAIRVASKLYEQQFRMDIKDLMMHPSISTLAPVLIPTTKECDQGIVQGEVLLSPIQHWFFDKQFPAMHHWNQSVLLYNPEGYDKDVLDMVLMKLIEQHDALRMVYQFNCYPPKQKNRGMDDKLLGFTVYEVSPQVDAGRYICQEIVSLQSSMNLSQGPLVQAGLFQTMEGDHLFLAIHHLASDGVSFRILLEDLSQAYDQAEEGGRIILPKKTDSYQAWVRSLYEYSISGELLKEIPYWREMKQKTLAISLSKDKHAEEHKQRNKRIVRLEITPNQTQLLLKEVHRAYLTEMNDILLTALGLAVHNWTKQIQVLINLEAHGREELNTGLSISRTVGWFTSQFPVLLDLSYSEDLSHQIKVIKEDLRNIPNKGIGYEVLKYLTPEELRPGLAFAVEPEICFNYLGQLDNEINTGKFTTSPFSSGASLGPDGYGNLGQENGLYFPLVFTGFIQNNQLHFTISYNEQEYCEGTIEHLADQYKRQLLNVIDHCVSKVQTERTPSDFSHSHLKLKEIEKVYALLEQALKKI